MNRSLWRERLKWLLYPGMNLHARLRFRRIGDQLGRSRAGQVREVLDAGCGNGMLSYQSWRKENHVLGISIKQGEVDRCRRFFHGFLEIPEERLRFEVGNLYRLGELGRRFDEVICCEVLEHIRQDAQIVAGFALVLKPGGILHLCCPNAEHPGNLAVPLDLEEKGGHVRPGYTMADYRRLLEPAGFEVVGQDGLGGPVRQALNRRITRTQERLGPAAGLPLFLLSFLLLWLDPANPRMPYSIYVRARRTGTPEN